jgi:hypothetical protein
MNLDTRFEQSSHVMARTVGSETVLLNLKTGTYFGLDEVGTVVWSALAAGRSLAETCSEVARQFDAPTERIEEDVRRVVGELLRAELLVETRP